MTLSTDLESCKGPLQYTEGYICLPNVYSEDQDDHQYDACVYYAGSDDCVI